MESKNQPIKTAERIAIAVAMVSTYGFLLKLLFF